MPINPIAKLNFMRKRLAHGITRNGPKKNTGLTKQVKTGHRVENTYNVPIPGSKISTFVRTGTKTVPVKKHQLEKTFEEFKEIKDKDRAKRQNDILVKRLDSVHVDTRNNKVLRQRISSQIDKLQVKLIQRGYKNVTKDLLKTMLRTTYLDYLEFTGKAPKDLNDIDVRDIMNRFEMVCYNPFVNKLKKK